MSNLYQKLIQSTLIVGGIFATTPLVWAASFTINSGETVTTTQTLSVDGDTGLIISGGFLDLTGSNNTRAVNVTADNVIVTNNGSISSTGSQDSITIGDQNNVTVVNNGTITVSGRNGDGVAQNNGSNFVFTNNGTITASANNASAIVVGFNTGSGVGSTITNNNIIRVTGSGSVGILLVNANGTTINNSGLISADESATQSIDGSNNADTLNLLSGSQIIGIIDLNGDTDIVNISGANNSSTLNLTDVENINLLNSNGLLVSDVVTMVDPTGQ